MTPEQITAANKLRNNLIVELDDINEYFNLERGKSTLDGRFTANELRRIAYAMDLMTEELEK